VTHTEDDLWNLLQQANRMPYGAGKTAMVEQVIRHADAGQHTELAFVARMLGTNAYVYGGEPAKSFATFSWCLAEYDQRPQPYHVRHAHNLLWHFKTMVSALTRFPDVPLERTYAVLDDMERRYRAGGHSMHAVYANRHSVAEHIGDFAASDRWYDRWCATPRDDLSDCAGCDPTSKAWHLVDRERDEEAVALAEPVLAGQFSCTEQPQSILGTLLLPYLRTGRLAEARDAHRRAYRLIRGNLADLADIGGHVWFCAVTGNEARGLEIVQRHLDWLDRAPSPYAAMEFASAAGLLLRRLAGGGHGELTVHRRAHGDRPAADVSVGALGAELTELSAGIAARFDARNGTDYQSRRMAERLAAEPMVEYLPLSAVARRRPVPPATVAPDQPAPVVAPAPAELAAPEIPAEGTALELLDVIERYARTNRPGAAWAVLRVLDERYPVRSLTGYEAARRAEARGHERAEREDMAAAEELWRSAAEGYRAAGEQVRAHGALGKVGLALCLSERADEGLPLVEASAAYVGEHGDPSRRASAYSRLGMALLATGRAAEALAQLDRAAAEVEQADDRYLTADVLLRRAHCITALDRTDELPVAVTAALDAARPLGGDVYVAASLLAAATVVEPTEAVKHYDEAVAAARGRLALDARAGRARALLGLDRVDEAVDDLVEVVAACTEQGLVEGAAFTRFELAQAYRRADRALEAAEAAEEAVAALDRLGAQEGADRCRYLLAGIYQELDEDEPALGVYDQLIANLNGFDNLPARGQMLEESGDLLYRKDRDADAAARFADAAHAYRQAELPLDSLRARRRVAIALRWAQDDDGALAALAEADAAAAALPESVAAEPGSVWELAMLGYDATRVLIGAERLDDALPRILKVPQRFRSVEAFAEAVLAELLLGEVLLRLERPGQAEPVLRGVLTGLPRDAEALPQAAWLLGQSLAMQGREDEAAALRDEYGLEDQ
jgi:tetratricopeptide (TPR) repeat protein